MTRYSRVSKSHCRTATHCNTLQHTATHCTTMRLEHSRDLNTRDILIVTWTHCNLTHSQWTHETFSMLLFTHCNLTHSQWTLETFSKRLRHIAMWLILNGHTNHSECVSDTLQLDSFSMCVDACAFFNENDSCVHWEWVTLQCDFDTLVGVSCVKSLY